MEGMGEGGEREDAWGNYNGLHKDSRTHSHNNHNNYREDAGIYWATRNHGDPTKSGRAAILWRGRPQWGEHSLTHTHRLLPVNKRHLYHSTTKERVFEGFLLKTSRSLRAVLNHKTHGAVTRRPRASRTPSRTFTTHGVILPASVTS